MARRRASEPRRLQPDPRHGDSLLTKITNYVMRDGKKSIAENIVYKALDFIQENKSGEDALEILKTAVDKVAPAVEVRSRRVGGANYQVPTDVRPKRRTALALRWIIDAARKRGHGKKDSMARNLADEILDIIQGRGGAMRQAETTFKMAEANKAFSHYRWGN